MAFIPTNSTPEEDDAFIEEMYQQQVRHEKEGGDTFDYEADHLAAKDFLTAKRTKDRRKLFDTIKGLSEAGKLDIETYERLKGREGGLLDISPEQFDTAFQEAGIDPHKQQRTSDRRKLFDTVKGLSEKGRLDTETYDLLKGREGGLVDLTPEQFDKTFQEAGIVTSDRAGGLRRKDFASSEAFNRAVAERNDGQAAPFAGGALRQAPRELGSRSGAMNRAGRRLRRLGAWGEAQKAFGAAAAQKMNEPNITTEEQRGRLAGQQQQAAEAMQRKSGLAKQHDELAARIIARRNREEEERGRLRYQGLGANPASNINRATQKRGL